MKFKVGDRVKVVRNISNLQEKYDYVGKTYIIKNTQGIHSEYGQSYGIGQTYVVYENELEFVFTKADLKSGMVVECHNGDRYLVVNDRLINHEGWLRISNFSNNLSSDSVEFTIDKVYETIGYNFQTLFNDGKLTLIWEREAPAKKMTVEEIEKELGYKVEIISKEAK